MMVRLRHSWILVTTFLLAWTLTVTGTSLDRARGEWVLSYDVTDDSGAAVLSGTLQVSPATPLAEIQRQLREALKAARPIAPPIVPGFRVTDP